MNLKKFNLKKLNLTKTKILILVLLVTISLFLIGISYAYFQNQFDDGAKSELEILSGTVDNLFFDIEKPLYINASVFNFGSGMENVKDDTDATATLVPNNTTYQAQATYNIYLVIEENELEYTTDEHIPELVFNVIDPNGKSLENITGLLHYENGFDITTRTGGFLIASDYVIEADNEVANQTWNISIEFVNLDSNQNANLDKKFSAKIYMTTDKMSSYNPIQVTNIDADPTYNTVDATLSITNGTAPAEKYFFAIEESGATTGYINNNNGVVRLNNKLVSSDTVEYIETDNPNYEFKSLKENTEYIIYSYVEDANRIKSNTYETKITTNEYALPSVGEVTHSTTLNSITLNVNASNGDGKVVTYMYSKDNGISWETSASNTYTFNNLSDTTEYKIKVKVVDSNGRSSTEYYEAISTETYILPTVANVEYTTKYNSITLTPTGANGTGTISKYVYSINNGAYQDSNVFSGLTENTTYTVSVKAIDNNNRESNPYTIQIKTDTYKVPTISNVTTSSTTNSITINVTGANGDGEVTKYMYSRDSGSNWYESTSNSYTFSNLTSNTTFYVQVKVVDNNNRESAVSNTTIKTQYLNPVVNSVSTSNITTSSITLTVNATPGSNNITTYYYSNNNGASYVSSTSNTYTFSGLSAGTTYNFRVYTVDNGGVKSNEVTNNATTLYIKPAVNSLIATDTSSNSITVSVSASGGTNAVVSYKYYLNNTLVATQSSNVYTYSSLSVGTEYTLTVVAVDSANVESDVYSINAETDNIVYLCSTGTNLASCIISQHNGIQGNNGIYYHTSNLANSAGDNSYRYSGANPNNYVCFGDDCNNENNLYRIIGVFGNQIKLIKATSIGNYVWDSGNNSTWNSSIKPDIYTTLNTTYYNTLTSTWRSKIATYSYKVGGALNASILFVKPQEVYSYELGSNQTGYAQSMKIGLMYITDYGFAASNNYWTTSIISYDSASNSNWMFVDNYEWTITPCSNNYVSTYYIHSGGAIFHESANKSYKVRPAFYLTSSITYVSGAGTASDPMIIK